jgi:hypothetical protein
VCRGFEWTPHVERPVVRRKVKAVGGLSSLVKRQEFDRADFEGCLREAFGGKPGERRAVARAAADLSDSEQYLDDAGIDLTPAFVVGELENAPLGPPSKRWNWWIQAMEVAYGGYEQFTVRQWESIEE